MDDWRDLGGIPTTDGSAIRPGALVRAGSLDHLDADGWAAIHACMGGRDRTGMIAMLVLTLVGVRPQDIAEDYELSATDPEIAAGLARAGTTARAELLRTLAEIDLAPFEPVRAPLIERSTSRR